MLEKWPALITIAALAVAYLLIGRCVASRGSFWNDKRIVLDPRKILVGGDRRTSLSKFQALYFTMIVLGVIIYWLSSQGELMDMGQDLVMLLGIGGTGTLLGKGADNIRAKISQPNFLWIRRKKWIRKDLLPDDFSNRKPQWFDLIVRRGKFDISRFQAVGFTLIIGIAILYQTITAASDGGGTAFKIGATYMGLIGVSQALYVGGKFSPTDKMKQLNQKLDDVREREKVFYVAVGGHQEWMKDVASREKSSGRMNLARECASKEYGDFWYAAKEAAAFVGELTGKPVCEAKIVPDLPLG